MGLIPIIDGNYDNRDVIEEELVDFLRALSLTNHKLRDEVHYLLQGERPPDKVSGELGFIWPEWRGPLEKSGAELQDALGGLRWDTLQFHGQHDLAIAEMRR